MTEQPVYLTCKLWKQDTGPRRKWHENYFTLTGSFLFRYKEESKLKVHKSYNVRGCHVYAARDEGSKSTFHVVGEKKKFRLVLAAATSKLREVWVESIAACAGPTTEKEIPSQTTSRTSSLDSRQSDASTESRLSASGHGAMFKLEKDSLQTGASQRSRSEPIHPSDRKPAGKQRSASISPLQTESIHTPPGITSKEAELAKRVLELEAELAAYRVVFTRIKEVSNVCPTPHVLPAFAEEEVSAVCPTPHVLPAFAKEISPEAASPRPEATLAPGALNTSTRSVHEQIMDTQTQLRLLREENEVDKRRAATRARALAAEITNVHDSLHGALRQINAPTTQTQSVASPSIPAISKERDVGGRSTPPVSPSRSQTMAQLSVQPPTPASPSAPVPETPLASITSPTLKREECITKRVSKSLAQMESERSWAAKSAEVLRKLERLDTQIQTFQKHIDDLNVTCGSESIEVIKGQFDTNRYVHSIIKKSEPRRAFSSPERSVQFNVPPSGEKLTSPSRYISPIASMSP